jgi:uncharacterized protein YeaO (DUF488 family)
MADLAGFSASCQERNAARAMPKSVGRWEMTIHIKRAYDPAGRQDGRRVLVDGLWPRGVKKDALAITEWLREIAPSAPLRTWYGHDPKKWEGFRQKYRRELSQSPRRELLDELVAHARRGALTLVFGARDAERSNAAVIAEMIQEKL